jgi:precorrin-6x reductase
VTILILGGIAESKQLASELIEQKHSVIYSIVGLVRTPELNCEIHIGGFSSEDTMAARVWLTIAKLIVSIYSSTRLIPTLSKSQPMQ